MKLIVKYKKRKISLDVKKCSFIEMFRGLMFHRREKARALLLFDFKKPGRLKIHSCFVFFHFLAVWLDDKNQVIEIRKVKPWKFYVLPKKRFFKLVEIPLNSKYRRIIQLFCSRPCWVLTD